MKICTKCLIEKTLNSFHKDLCRKDGFFPQCKNCVKLYTKTHYKKNSARIKERQKNHYHATIDKQKAYRKANFDRIKKHMNIYRKINADKLRKSANQYTTLRKKTDPLYKFSCNVRSLLKDSFKRNKTGIYKKRTKTEALLGCTIPEFRDHLAKQFTEGMTFENHGQWHVDHVIPLASAKSQSEIEKLCHYTNLQPLWAADNIRKGKTINNT